MTHFANSYFVDASSDADLARPIHQQAIDPKQQSTGRHSGLKRSDLLPLLAGAGTDSLRGYRSSHALELSEFGEIWSVMDAASAAVMAKSLHDLGFLQDSDETITAEGVAAKCCSADRYQALMAQWLQALANSGYVRRPPMGTTTYAGVPIDVMAVRRRIDQTMAALDKPTAYPGFIEYFQTCVRHQTALLTGQVNPQKLLFPAGTSRLVEGLYRTNPAASMQNHVAAAVVRAAAHERTRTRPLRMLEVGAGTGATTAAVLRDLPPPFQYHFTDVSRFFLRRAARQFMGQANVTYELLDIDRPGIEQGFERHSYDIIVAANVLHTAKDIDQTLRYLQELLEDTGVLIAIETTLNTTLQMITFGHFEGVCHFQDQRRDSNLPFLSCGDWHAAFRAAGLDSVAAVPSPEVGSQGWVQHVLLGARASHG